jgi:hypothetical protein
MVCKRYSRGPGDRHIGTIRSVPARRASGGNRFLVRYPALTDGAIEFRSFGAGKNRMRVRCCPHRYGLFHDEGRVSDAVTLNRSVRGAIRHTCSTQIPSRDKALNQPLRNASLRQVANPFRTLESGARLAKMPESTLFVGNSETIPTRDTSAGHARSARLEVVVPGPTFRAPLRAQVRRV